MVDVYRYAEPVTAKGFVVMGHAGLRPGEHDRHCGGRGERVRVPRPGAVSVFGCKPAPCVEGRDQHPALQHMIGDMDIDAGKILDGVSVEGRGQGDL